MVNVHFHKFNQHNPSELKIENYEFCNNFSTRSLDCKKNNSLLLYIMPMSANTWDNWIKYVFSSIFTLATKITNINYCSVKGYFQMTSEPSWSLFWGASPFFLLSNERSNKYNIFCSTSVQELLMVLEISEQLRGRLLSSLPGPSTKRLLVKDC